MMFTNAMLVGRLGEALDENTRYIEIDHLDETSGRILSDRIPIRYWNKRPNCYLMKLRSGSLIAARGRIMTDRTCGLCIIIEYLALMHGGTLEVI